MSFMHLITNNGSPAADDRNIPKTWSDLDLALLVPCLYAAESITVPDLVRRYIQELESNLATSYSTRLQLRLASIKRYQMLLEDEELQKQATKEIALFVDQIHEEFPSITVKPEGRFKGFMSWFNKGTKILDDGQSIDTLNDIIAFRLVVASKKGGQKLSKEELVLVCYQIVNRMIAKFISIGYIPCKAEKVKDTITLSSPLLKSQKLYIPASSGLDIYYVSSVKDYILSPKANGYQSLHIIFRMPNGFTFEVQVRTAEMDKYATEGYGDHGAFKDATYTHVPYYEADRVPLTGTPGFDTPRSFKLLQQ